MGAIRGGLKFLLPNPKLSNSRCGVSSQDIKIGLIGISTTSLLAADLMDNPEFLQVLERPLDRGFRGLELRDQDRIRKDRFSTEVIVYMNYCW